MRKNKIIYGVSSDAIMLISVKLVTAVLGLLITRLLSRYLSVYEYGTYSQILLIVSAVSSITIFGMIDGVNYFYCAERDEQEKEKCVATMFTLQCIASAFFGCIVLGLSSPLSVYFKNPDIKKLLMFAAALPMLQNLINMLQVLIISVGRASLLALRNLLVSAVRLFVAAVIVCKVRSTWVILTATLILDCVQIATFYMLLRRSGCFVRFVRLDFAYVKKIFQYCAPMAIFVIINSVNRDIDKFLVAMWTDTETQAIYANASKVLPFDILMTSFATVLVPCIARCFAQKEYHEAARLCKLFFEIAYISMAILCCAALAVAPELMKMLYSNEYTAGLAIFCVYILVDLFKCANVTIILSAAGKTKWLMCLGIVSVMGNAALNVLLYNAFGLVGPAVSTLVITMITGVIMLCCDAKVLGTHFTRFFDLRFLCVFILESVILTTVLIGMRAWLVEMDVHYFFIIVLVAGLYGAVMLCLNGRRVFTNMKKVNAISQNISMSSKQKCDL